MRANSENTPHSPDLGRSYIMRPMLDCNNFHIYERYQFCGPVLAKAVLRLAPSGPLKRPSIIQSAVAFVAISELNDSLLCSYNGHIIPKSSQVRGSGSHNKSGGVDAHE